MIGNGRYYRWKNLPPTPPVDIEKKGSLNHDTGCYTIRLSGDQLGITTYDGAIEKTVTVVLLSQTVIYAISRDHD